MDKYQAGVRRAVRNLNKVVHPCLHISNGALKVLQILLTHLNGRMIEACQNSSKKGQNGGKKGKKGGADTMKEQAAQKAVDAVLPGLLRKCAIAEAHKCLTKYTAGALVYKPRILIQKKKKKSRTKTGTSPEFVRAVPVLAKLLDLDTNVDKDGRGMVADILQQMCNSVVEKSHAIASGNKLGPEDIIKAVDSCMAPTMAKHAIAEGARNALLFTKGCSKYKPEQFVYRLKNLEDEQELKTMLKDGGKDEKNMEQ